MVNQILIVYASKSEGRVWDDATVSAVVMLNRWQRRIV